MAVSRKVGSPSTFLLALIIILIWGLTGPFYSFSDTWQLIINTGTTIVTFLMVFIIQNTQTRDARAMQIKLDELIKSTKTARTELVDLEELSDEEITQLEADFRKLHQQEYSRATHALHQKVSQEHARRFSAK